MNSSMKVCKKCIQPDSRPGIFFSEDGICGACIWEEEKKKIDWNSREKELQDIADWAKKTTQSNYDCIIGVSGGKDTTVQALYAKENLGLRCLLVNSEPEGITEIGRHNIENLKQKGFDVITLRPNPKVMKKLIKFDFYRNLNPIKVTEYSLWSSAYIVTEKFGVPLIIQGENPGLTLGVSLTGLAKDSDALKANEQNTLSTRWEEYLDAGVTERDLFLFHYNRDNLEKKGVRGVWLQYFMKEWSQRKNAEFALSNGFKCRPSDFDPESIGTYVPYFQLDSDIVPVNQMFKCIKFGFGQCMDHVCYDIRDGKMSREEGIELVKKYDGKCSEYYIKKFCDYIEISTDEFWSVTEKFRGPMWTKNSDGTWNNEYHELF